MLDLDVKKRLRDFSLQVSLSVAEGEILMLVGDNGCGKTTLLNLISGLIAPDAGRITLRERSLFDSSLKIDVSPEERNIGYVFQSYALFPHMSVYENVAFGLRTRKVSLREIALLVRDHLEAAEAAGGSGAGSDHRAEPSPAGRAPLGFGRSNAVGDEKGAAREDSCLRCAEHYRYP
jgi:ABC-type Fe3+/spermidine/putrescine transport system ATPase subunit